LAKICASARQRASSLGFGMEVVSEVPGRTRPRRLKEILLNRGVRGILLAPLPEGVHELELEFDEFAVVAVGESLISPRLHQVGTDHFATAVLATRELKRAGFQRIGLCLTKDMNERTGRRWLGGYSAEIYSGEGHPPMVPLIMKGWEPRAFEAWWDSHRPEVVLTGHPAALAHWLESTAGMDGSIRLAGLNLNDPQAPFAGVYKDFGKIGAEAVDVLAHLLLRNERGVPSRPQHFLTEGLWHPGTVD